MIFFQIAPIVLQGTGLFFKFEEEKNNFLSAIFYIARVAGTPLRANNFCGETSPPGSRVEGEARLRVAQRFAGAHVKNPREGLPAQTSFGRGYH